MRSKAVVDGLTSYVEKWENNGWDRVCGADGIWEALACLRARSAVTTLRHLGEEESTEGEAGAMLLAMTAAVSGSQNKASLLATPMEFLERGAKLSTMLQKVVYMRRKRKSTHRTMTSVKAALETDFKLSAVSEEKIWSSVWHKDISSKIRDFLWKAMHQANRVGRYWTNIMDMQSRATCAKCDVEDLLEHILLHCEANECKVVWDLVRQVFVRKGMEVPEMSMGAILGAGVVTLKHVQKRMSPGHDRFFRIAVTESAHLIWRLRCEHVIGGELGTTDGNHELKKIVNMWHDALNRRMAVDCTMTLKRFGGKALQPDLVKQTWKSIIRQDLEKDAKWIYRPGVLVGMLWPFDDEGVG
ncbi:hypothetical protein C8Q80DRAFT_1217426 [Daedaleopsis nitida]|nr:hypothetical protein C8Q80DRAFT_1217426 [Daedaleopsis nitida]